MKDITIKITGKQCYDGTEEDQMEFVTDGRVYERNGYFYLIYDESEISGLEGFRTTLKFNENSLKMKRFSKEGPGPELYFRSLKPQSWLRAQVLCSDSFSLRYYTKYIPKYLFFNRIPS